MFEEPTVVPFTCPCGKFYHVADESQGHQVRCPFCYEIRDVPAPPPPPASPRRARRLRGSWQNALSLAALMLAVPIGGPTLIWVATLTQVAPASTPTDVAKIEDPSGFWGESSEPEAKLSPSPAPAPVEAMLPPPPPPTPDPPQPEINAETADPPPAPLPTPLRPNLAPGAYGVLRSPLYDSVTICPRWQTYLERFMLTVSPSKKWKRDTFWVPCNNCFNKVPNGTPVKILARETIEIPLVVSLRNMHLDRPRPHNLFQVQITEGPHQREIGYVPVEYIDPESLSDHPVAWKPEHRMPMPMPRDYKFGKQMWSRACPPDLPALVP